MTVQEMINIEKELQRIKDEGHAKDRIHAALFNLIIYTQKNARKEFFRHLVKSLISKFPCRLIFITADDKPNDMLNVDVQAEIIEQGGLQICCEQIEIEVSGKERQKVPFLILPHLIPDLPIYLIWAQDPAIESDILPHLRPIAKRVIFDSESAVNPQSFFKAVLKMIEDKYCDISDLGWTSLAGWRKIVTSEFNNFENFQYLEECKTIQIQYNNYKIKQDFEKNVIIRALYLQGWFAAQLNWSFEKIEQSHEEYKILYRNSKNAQVTMILIKDEVNDLPAGVITSIEIDSSKNEGHFVFKRHPQKCQVSIYQSDAQQCYLPHLVNLQLLNPGQEIVQELFSEGIGEHYQRMLNVVSKIN